MIRKCRALLFPQDQNRNIASWLVIFITDTSNLNHSKLLQRQYCKAFKPRVGVTLCKQTLNYILWLSLIIPIQIQIISAPAALLWFTNCLRTKSISVTCCMLYHQFHVFSMDKGMNTWLKRQCSKIYSSSEEVTDYLSQIPIFRSSISILLKDIKVLQDLHQCYNYVLEQIRTTFQRQIHAQY